MILFTQPDFNSTAARLVSASPGLRPGCFKTCRFHNGELYIELPVGVTGESCAILASIAPPDERLASTLLLADTLRRHGAKEVTAILPYLAYSRQDRVKESESLAAAWTGELMRASGINRVITIDVHNPEDQRLFPIPLISLSPAAMFADAIRRNHLASATIVAPDKGAIPRCEAVRAALGLTAEPVPHFEKTRMKEGIQLMEFSGQVGTEVVLIDDILDTGATLVSACQRLLCAGIEDIEIMVTHGLFTGDGWEELWELGVSRIFVTDTIPLPEGFDGERIVVLPADPLLAKALNS